MAARKSADATASGNGLEFEATLSGVRPVMAKKDQYGQGKPGMLVVELQIEQPEPPKLPHELNPGYGKKGFSKRPTEADVRNMKEDERAAHLEKLQKRWDDAKATYEAQQEAFRPRTLAYAQLVGLATVLGNQQRVSMTPIARGMLPGFSAQLLAAPEEASDDPDDEE